MKQKSLLKTMLLLFALIAGSSSVWAASAKVTFDFSSNDAWDFPTSTSTTDASYSDGTNSIAIHAADGYYWTSSVFLLIGKSGSTITLPTFSFNVSKIAVTFSGSTSEKVTVNFFVGDDAVSTQVKATKGTTADFEIAAAKQAAGNVYVLKVTNANNVQIKKIEVYEAADIAAPTITPNGSDDISATHSCEVTLACDGVDAIYYTTDGSDPKTSATKTIYSAPFTVSGFKTVVKAVAKKGEDFSAVTTATFKDPTIQPLNFTLELNNAFFGTSYTGSNAKGTGPHSNTAYGVTVTFTSGGSTKDFYISDSEIRAYSGNTLKLDAPDGYAFTQMTFASAWNSSTTIEGGGSLNSGRTVWSNPRGSSSVTFAPGGKTTVTTIACVLTETIPVTIASSGYSTLATSCGLDFANATPAGLEAYVASAITASGVTLSSITAAPKNTGVILKGEAGTEYTIPVKTDAAAIAGTNYLKAAVAAYNCAANEVYILKGGKFCKVTAASTVPAGKAYLLAEDVPVAAPELEFNFGGTTAIDAIQKQTKNGEFYNLAGLRVANPSKGLYIVNGKKVVIK